MNNRPCNAYGFALLLMSFVISSLASSSFAAEGIPTLYPNQVQWGADGKIQATVHEVEVIGGVTGNYWPDAARHETLGQTFRCDGPILKAVQLGLGDVDTGYLGVTVQGKIRPTMFVRVRESGPQGRIVASRTYEPSDFRRDLLLEVNQPSSPEDTWYLELGVTSPTAPEDQITLNATWTDSYPHGAMHINGRPTQADLHMRVHRAEERSGSFPGKAILWTAPIQKRIWLEPDRTVADMLRDNPQQPVTLSGAGNEWVTTQVVVTPSPDFQIQAADIQVAPFKSTDGKVIESSNIHIEHLRYLKNFRRGKTSEFLYPDPLSPARAVTTSQYPEEFARSNQTFVVSIQIPQGQPAGEYQSTVTVKLNDDVQLQRPVTLTVHGFSLPHETHTRTGLFKDLSNKPIDKHLALAKDLASFRIATGNPFHLDETQILRRGEFSAAAYDTALGEAMQQSLLRTGELLNRKGLQLNSVVTPWADTYRLFRNQNPEEAREKIRQFWSVYYPLLKEHGLADQVHARMVDEVDGEELMHVRDIAKLFREYAPGIKLMVTAIGTPDELMLSRAIGIADIWSPSSRYFDLAMDFYKARVEAGEEVWPYIHDHAFLQTDSAGPLLFFWMIEKHGMQGATYFSIRRAKVNHTWYGLEQHTDTWAGDGDLYFAPPSDTDSPLWRSLRLHLIRDGIEDREYFWLVNDLKKRAQDQGAMSDASQEAVKAVGILLDRIVWGGVSFDSDPQLLNEARSALVTAIASLQSDLNIR